ncbi:Outer membrane receptor protein [Paramagnetospirillum caucaseum]|uniref:Outer membrane receptor protein n=1 Tax=Paramagnetospirillum caucaseum TaxID=1244869 RepID=M2Z070_9PROT|nr:TonB-dependent receptor [Paramagnetospirillum caucaseum]EME67660.1 Outer membrane receptor protein [Paramagnetospirillum caucaseum]
MRKLPLLAALVTLADRSDAAELPKLFPDQSFIDTRYMPRHAGQDLPPLMLLADLPVAEPLMPAKTAWPVEFFAQRRAAAAAARNLALTGGAQGNGAVSTTAGLANMEAGDVSLWGGVRHDRVKPYEDGAGQRVNYSYDRDNTQLAASWRPAPKSRLSGFVMRDAYSNQRIPNYGIDATRTDRYLASTVFEHAPQESRLDRIETGLVFDALSYDADNTSLRDQGSLGLKYLGLWTTARGLVRGEFTTGAFRNTLTADFGILRYNIDIDSLYPAQGQAVHRMPDVQTLQAGLTYATATRLSAQDSLSAALRLDAIHSDPNDRSNMPPVSGSGASSFQVTPQSLWNSYYGNDGASRPSNLNVSGRAQLTHDLEDKSGRLHIDLRRAVRSPDPGERFYASSGPASITQVGNPQLAPEAHHRLEIGARKDHGGFKGNFAPGNPAGSWRLAATVHADRVADFITADRARGQAGILKSDGAIVYRNVDAYLAGAGLEGWWQVSEGWAARAKLSWTRGENLTDARPLYQVPPLDGEMVIEHRRELAADTVGSAGARLSFAASQDRIDAYTASGSGQDTAGGTAGWALLDLFAGVAVGDRAAVTAGIANVLDKHYHLHVNPLPQSPTTRLQWAPGRSAFVQATVSF